MSLVAKKCGIQLQPPSIILIYEDQLKKNIRKRIMPVRNFSRFSDCSRAAEQLKNNPRHKAYLEGVSLEQLQKLHRLLRCHLEGQTLTQSLEQIKQEETVDLEEDLNKLDDKELAERKKIMDELFEKNRKKKDDPDFVYNVEVAFPQDEELEAYLSVMKEYCISFSPQEKRVGGTLHKGSRNSMKVCRVHFHIPLISLWYSRSRCYSFKGFMLLSR